MDCMWEGKEADENRDNEAQGEHFPVFSGNNTREVLMESLMLIPCRIPCDFDSPSAYYKILKTRFWLT